MKRFRYEAIKSLPEQPVEDVRAYEQCPVCEVTGRNLSNHDCRGFPWWADGPSAGGSVVTTPTSKVKPLN